MDLAAYTISKPVLSPMEFELLKLINEMVCHQPFFFAFACKALTFSQWHYEEP
jgi:hypothetical protein